MSAEKEALNQDKTSPPPTYQQTYPGQGAPPGQYPPQQGPYPPLQGQYPPPQGGYPTPQGGYPGYQPVPQGPPQGQGYPQQGYPGGYPQQPGQQPGYPQGYTTQQVVVAQPGQAPIVVTQARPPDYLVPSILACLCCFCPTGACAIYYACKANDYAREGDMVESARMANNARNLMIVSIVVGVIWIVLTIILRLFVLTTKTHYSYSY